jgi:DNA helicase-2/ATP-dependent DNA helicase PcrA
VGDDSQSIYKFRGPSISNILNFMKDYPLAKKKTLTNNYRSNQTILNTSYRLIKNNDPDTLEAKLGISKKLISQKQDDKKQFSFIWLIGWKMKPSLSLKLSPS